MGLRNNGKKILSMLLGIFIIFSSMFGTVSVFAEDVQTPVASFMGTNTVTEWDVNDDGLTITIGLNQGYNFVNNVADYKDAIIDGLTFNATIFNKTTGQYEPVSLETFISNELNLYGISGYFPYIDQANGITVYDRFVGLNPAGAKSTAVVNEETQAAYPGVKQGIVNALKAGATVSVNGDGNLVIKCTKDAANGYFATFTNSVPVVNGGIPIANCDILLSANLPIGTVQGVSEVVTVSDYFTIQEVKLHPEVWEYVDESHKDEEGVYAFNTKVGTIGAPGSYSTTYYVRQVAGDVLTEDDIRTGGTMGPNGTGDKLIKVVIDNRVGPTQWADKNYSSFYTNLFRTNAEATGYSGLSNTTYTPADDAEWLKVENQLLNGGSTYYISTNKYVVNYSADNRFDTANPAEMWMFYELPPTSNFNITEDMPIYVNLIGGFVGGSGQSVAQQGQPILGMDGRFSFTITESDMSSYNAALAAVCESDYTADSWSEYQVIVAANSVDAQTSTPEEIDTATAAIIAAQAQLVPFGPTGLEAVAPTQYGLSDGIITGAAAGMEYKLSTDETYTAVTGTSINGLVAGTYHVRYAAKDGYNASAVANVIVPDGTNLDQTAPIGLEAVAPTQYGHSDGKITGTAVGMEYKLSTDETYTAVTGTSINGLAAGTYKIRYAAKNGYNASAVIDVIVPNGVNKTNQILTLSENNNISLTATGYIPAGYELIAKKIESDTTDFKNINVNVPSGALIVGCYDIHFENDGTTVDINQPISLTFNVGSQYNGFTAIIYHDHNGKITEYTAIIKDGKAVIEVNNFSNFLVSISNYKSDVVNSVAPKTGDNTSNIIYVSLLLIALAGGFSLKFKICSKKNMEVKN